MPEPPPSLPRLAGQYVVCDEIAAGGTATVHFGRLLGRRFARTVAIKRLHPAYARDPVFVDMFLDEARLATRIRHPNVCSVLDVVTMEDVPCLVMDYVHGEPLARLIHAVAQNDGGVPYEIAAGIVCGMLQGLHAAHEATDDRGEPLHIIHRDVSPQNVLVGIDGVPRVVDFGLAKAAGRLQNTAEGHLKGKLGYMAPEQFALKPIDRRVDVYSAAVVLWEALTGQFLFERAAPSALMHAILEGDIRPPSSVVPDIPPELDAVCIRALSRDPADRFATAHDMAVAIEAAIILPSAREIGAWVGQVAGDGLRARADVLARVEAEHPSAPSLPPAPSSALGIAEPKAAPKQVSYKRAVVLALTVVILSLLVYVAVGAPRSSAPPPPLPLASAQTPPIEVAAVPAPTPAPIESEAPEAPVATREPSASPPPRSKQLLNCTPPYTVDAEGIRHPKRRCLVPNPVPAPSRPSP